MLVQCPNCSCVLDKTIDLTERINGETKYYTCPHCKQEEVEANWSEV